MKMKTPDCVKMKRAAQEAIREAAQVMTREEEVRFFRAGAEEFEERIRKAREQRSAQAFAPARDR